MVWVACDTDPVPTWGVLGRVMQRDAVSDRGSIMIDNRLTVLNIYELKKSPADFEIAVALARRVEAEGHPGVLSYRLENLPHVTPGARQKGDQGSDLLSGLASCFSHHAFA